MKNIIYKGNKTMQTPEIEKYISIMGRNTLRLDIFRQHKSVFFICENKVAILK